LSEQLEREVSAEELLKQTKSTNSNKNAAPPSSAPAPFDTSYHPNPPGVATPEVVAPPAAVAPPPAYSPETADAVHGADWHASPPENKSFNE
jgi:hypothetical protein